MHLRTANGSARLRDRPFEPPGSGRELEPPEKAPRSRFFADSGKILMADAAIVMAIFCHSFPMVAIMAREANPLKSEQITLSVNAQTVWYLDRLVETGLYGNNRTEAARIAIYDHCKLVTAQGTIEMAPRLPSRDVTALR
jgi:hypothetical protein